MMKALKIYLSGSVKKKFQKKENLILWSDIVSGLSNFINEKGIPVEIFDPSKEETQQKYENIFQAEMDFIANCDWFLVELSQKRGLGVGVEMLHAVNNGVEIYAICPDQGYYRKDDIKWLHPFVKNLSTKIVNDLDELISFLNTLDLEKYK